MGLNQARKILQKANNDANIPYEGLCIAFLYIVSRTQAKINSLRQLHPSRAGLWQGRIARRDKRPMTARAPTIEVTDDCPPVIQLSQGKQTVNFDRDHEEECLNVYTTFILEIMINFVQRKASSLRPVQYKRLMCHTRARGGHAVSRT